MLWYCRDKKDGNDPQMVLITPSKPKIDKKNKTWMTYEEFCFELDEFIKNFGFTPKLGEIGQLKFCKKV